MPEIECRRPTGIDHERSGAELKLLTFGEEFERSTGHKLSVTTGFSPSFTKRTREGETFDLVFAPAPAITSSFVGGISSRAQAADAARDVILFLNRQRQ